jgi:hypothetical protein
MIKVDPDQIIKLNDEFFVKALSNCEDCPLGQEPVEESKKKPEEWYGGYRAFAGIDCKVYFVIDDGSADSCPEIQSLSWSTDLEAQSCAGTILAIMFDHPPILVEEAIQAQTRGKKVTVHLNFQNEYGAVSHAVLENVKFKKSSFGISVDDIVLTVRYDYTSALPKWDKEIYRTPQVLEQLERFRKEKKQEQ